MLKDKVMMVTSALAGTGRAVAQVCAREGANSGLEKDAAAAPPCDPTDFKKWKSP